MNKLQEFIAIVNSKLGAGYVYGGQNSEPLTKEALATLVNKFGKSHYYFANYSAERWLGKEYYDCSGLIVYALRKIGVIGKNLDYTSQAIYSKLCNVITKNELKAGDLCFTKTSGGIVHVGIYMGDNRVTHARGTFYGVVNTELFKSFNEYGRLKFFANNYPAVKVNFEDSIKKVIAATNVFEQPYDKSISIGSLIAGSLVKVEGIFDNSWYMVSLGEKKGYVPFAVLSNYDELLEALTFLSEKTGVSKGYWYNQAGLIKHLDTCFIKIAKGFKGDLK